jgi:hypothetical protein
MLLEWSTKSSGNCIEDDSDIFVVHDGLIRVQTVRYTLHAH